MQKAKNCYYLLTFFKTIHIILLEKPIFYFRMKGEIALSNIYDMFESQKLQSLAKWLYSLTPLEISTIGCIIGLIGIETLSVNEQNVIGNFLELIGQILLTSNAQASCVDPNFISPSLCNMDQMKKDLEGQIFQIQREINKIKKAKAKE